MTTHTARVYGGGRRAVEEGQQGEGEDLRYYFSETKRVPRTRSSWLVCGVVNFFMPAMSNLLHAARLHSLFTVNIVAIRGRGSTHGMSLRKFPRDLHYHTRLSGNGRRTFVVHLD